MPILTYIVAVGGSLFCLICYAPALFGPPPPMTWNTSFYSVDKPAKKIDGIQILAAQDSPAPDMEKAERLSAASTQPVAEAAAEGNNVKVAAAAPKLAAAPRKRKVVRTHAEPPRGTRYVQYPSGPNPGWIY
jgi:hypothetical protein